MYRVFDIILIILILPFLLPLIIVIAVISRVLNGADVFFIQDRVGKDQKNFKLIKFRTMIKGAQNMGTGLYSYAGDNRITPFGQFLRKTSLDELPQIFNVILGNMSFVGPRPPVVGELDAEINLPSNMNLRFEIKPGLTGWAQIHGRNSLSWTQKVQYDIEFVKASTLQRLKMTLYILLFTPFYLLNFSATYEIQR